MERGGLTVRAHSLEHHAKECHPGLNGREFVDGLNSVIVCLLFVVLF